MKTFDVIVVGGGIIGAVTACELRQAGFSVAVLDKGMPGEESSLAAVGVLAPHAGPHLKTPFVNFLRENLSVYPDFVRGIEEETGMGTDFCPSGLLYLAFDEEGEKELEERHGWQIQSGIKVEWLSGSEIRVREPWVGKEVRKGVYFPEDCHVDNVKLMQAVLKRAETLGVTFFPRTAASRIIVEAGKVRGLETSYGKFDTPAVVDAAGAWANFDASLPFRIPVKPSRGQILTFKHDVPLFKHMIHLRGTYLVNRSDGRLLVGTTVESAGYNKEVTAKGLNKLSEGLLKVNPELAFLKFTEAWAGLRPRSRDSQPLIGKTPVEGLFLAAGHFRNGVLAAPLTARILREIMEGKNPSFDIAPFDVSRFEKISPHPFQSA